MEPPGWWQRFRWVVPGTIRYIAPMGWVLPFKLAPDERKLFADTMKEAAAKATEASAAARRR